MNKTITGEKRILSVLLAVIMVLSMMPLSVFAANGAAAEVTTAGGGTVSYLNYADAVGYANRNGGTLRLLSDIEAQYESLDDAPFITGTFTLDLNGKSIDLIEVGSYGFDEETEEEIKGTPGTLTVTDSAGDGQIEELAVYAGALTVEGGTTEHLYADRYAATVDITGGVVEELTLNDGEDGEISATVSGGSVPWIRMSGGTLTVSGGDYRERMDLFAGNGTVNITGGMFADLQMTISFGEVRLTGGAFTRISTEPVAGSSEYQKPTLASLLGDGCAFYGAAGIVNADVLTLENVKILGDHQHSYSGGKCTGCGAPCPHDRVEIAMGVCEDCGTQLEAMVTYSGKEPVFFTSFLSAIDSVPHNMKEQVTVTLLKSGYDLGTKDLYLEKNNNIRLDLNYHNLFGSGTISVGGNSALTIANGDLDKDLTVEAAGGDVTVEKDCGSVGTIRVTDAGSVVTVRGGEIGSLRLPAIDTESLKNIKLSGGKFGTISFAVSGTVTITDLLEAGYALKDNHGTLKTNADGLVSYGLTVDARTSLRDLEVVECGHSEVNVAKGYCSFCGKLYAGKITDKNGAVRYAEELQNGDFADGSTVVLLQDIKDTIIPKGSCTIEMNGRSASMVSFIVQGETLTLKGYGKIGVVVIGYQDIDSTLVIEDAGYRQRIEIGTLSVNKTTNTKLTGGQFDKIERKDGGFVADLLADDHAFFDKTWEMPEYIAGETSLNKTYYIAEHHHWFIVNIDGETQCQECGMPCHHTTIGADGKCADVCKRQIYVATVTKADGTETKYEAFADAFAAAAESEDATLTLLCDVDLDGDELTLDHGKFTLDLGSYTLKSFAHHQVLAVSGTADIIIKNGVLHNTFDTTKGGQLFVSTGNAIDMKGGSLTLDGVTLRGAYEENSARPNGEIQCYALELSAGDLTVENGAFIGSLAVYKVSGETSPTVKITSATLHHGLLYTVMGKDRDDNGLAMLFADGSMLFDENGKYIDVTSDSYWDTAGDEEQGIFYTGFYYENEVIVKPHEHTFADGKCAECDYACPHDGGNEREATYFEKAICAICHSEYGECVKDTTAPTGKIEIRERAWWQTLLNKITFDLFYKETVTLAITGEDDSGRDVAIYYTIESAAAEDAEALSYEEYTGAVDLSDERQYVIYAVIEDWAGNRTYLSSDGFEIDKTAPAVEVIAPVSRTLDDGGAYVFCTQRLVFRAADKNLKDVTIGNDDALMTDGDGNYVIESAGEYEFVLTDQAGNESRVRVTLYAAHDFDQATGKCRHCKADAAVKVENGELTAWFADGDELFKALTDEKFSGATVTLQSDVTVTKKVSPSGEAYLMNDLTIDLNGKTLQGPENGALVVFGGSVRIWSSNGEGTLAANLCVFGANASLTMDSGIGEARRVMFREGHLAIYSGRYAVLNSVYTKGSVAEQIDLYGGSYGSVYLAETGSATAEQLLGKNCRYDGVNYATAQAKKQLSNVSVIPCDHADLNEFVCTGCGMEIFLAAEVNGTEKRFGTFEETIRYAEQNDGCTVKLLRDIKLDEAMVGSLLVDGYKVELTTGKYTIDLNGKALDVNIRQVAVFENGDLTIGDSAGGGKVISSIGAIIRTGNSVNNKAKLTVTGGDFDIVLRSYDRSALVLKGGSFDKYVVSDRAVRCSPFVYLADGYTFALTNSTGGNNYANEGNVEADHDGSQMIKGVSVVPAPLVFLEQPRDVTFYLTSTGVRKCVDYLVSYVGNDTDKEITLTLEKADGSKIATIKSPVADEIMPSFDLAAFGAEHSGQYRVRAEFCGYVLYSDTFTVTIAECEHPGYDRSTGKCTQCRCDLAAAIVKSGKTTGYVNFADALAAAQTEENRHCELWLLTDVTGKITVSTGDFILRMNGHTVGAVNVTKIGMLDMRGSGTVTGTVTVAKNTTALLNATGITFKGTVNANGSYGIFADCTFAGTLNIRGNDIDISGCALNGALNISGHAVRVRDGSITGLITVNSGGVLQFFGDDGKYGTALVKAGGTMKVYANSTFSGEVAVENDGTLLLEDGTYKQITVAGKRLIDCLAADRAFWDINNETVIDGRNPIAGDVRVVRHTHSCVWNTKTHEKLCGCGYVEAVDTEAPVISSIKDGGVYYNLVYFSVTDANDFTVTVDGTPVQIPLTGYLLLGDNQTHTITATDVAGNTVTVTVTVYKLYFVTLPRDTAGYTVKGVSAVGHGMDYEFTVKIADGYSKTEDYRVLVNGAEIDAVKDDETEDTFLINNVSEDLVITVEGVADITAPEVEVSIRGNSFKEFLNRITFGLFFKQTQTVEVKADDFGSGVKKVEYLLSAKAFTDKDAITGEWTEVKLNDQREAWFGIEPNQKTFVYVRVTDMSDNITVVNTDGVVVYTDAEAVTGTMTIKRLDGADASFAVRLNGNTVDAVYNGDTMLADGDYTVAENGVITLKAGYLSALAAGEYTIRVAYDPMGESFDRGDAPAMTSVKLTVKKNAASFNLAQRAAKTYDGDPIDPAAIDGDMSTDGAMTWAFKPAGADDSAYTATAPKAAGTYTVRLTTAETADFYAGEATVLFVIEQKAVTITGVRAENKTYDGKTEASIASDGTIFGLIGGDEVTVVRGKAAFGDKNVDTGKSVTFTGFAIDGPDAANYRLAKQPESATADITAKELTIDGLKVKNKPYDGTNTAEIDGKPTLVGVVDGDTVQLLCGVPTFDRVTVGKGIGVSFTKFALIGDSTIIGNYELRQPAGIMADIVAYLADGSEYAAGSHDWINNDFVIKAKERYLLSLTDAADGTWTDTLTASNETGDGELVFYVKNVATGAISAAVTENYKIDKTAPTGTVELIRRSALRRLVNKLTFGLFFNEDVRAVATTADEASGVKTVWWLKSDKTLTADELRAADGWTVGSEAEIAASDKESFIIYVRIEDNAGNIGYAASDGATFDTTAPKITGIENGGIYYVTKKAVIDDENLERVTLDGDPVGREIMLAGDVDVDTVYVIRAVDEAGNVTEYTVTMKPIAAVTDAVAQITADNVKSSDADTIAASEQQIAAIEETLDEAATDGERAKLTAAKEACAALRERIAAVADEICRLTDGVNGFDIDRVTSDDKAQIEELIAGIDALLGGDNLTDGERAALEELKDTAQALTDRIAAAKAAAESDEIRAVDGITKDNVKREDKDALTAAKKAAEDALRDFDGNYTDEEREALKEKTLDTVQAALDAIGNAEKAAEEIDRLPTADEVGPDDKDEVDRVKKIVDGLTENERAMLGEAAGKPDALIEKIRALADSKNDTPKTGEMSDLALWFALLFVSGWAFAGIRLAGKKKTEE